MQCLTFFYMVLDLRSGKIWTGQAESLLCVGQDRSNPVLSSCTLMRECLTSGIFSPGVGSRPSISLFPCLAKRDIPISIISHAFLKKVSFHKTFKTIKQRRLQERVLLIISMSVLKNQYHVMMVDLNLINRNWPQLLLCTV